MYVRRFTFSDEIFAKCAWETGVLIMNNDVMIGGRSGPSCEEFDEDETRPRR